MRALLVALAVALCLPAAVAVNADAAIAEAKPVAAAPARPSATSIWEPLVWPGARYRLIRDGGAPFVEVEVYDARLVKDARVARIRWTYIDSGTRTPLDSSLPTQLAVTKQGVYLLTERADDEQVAATLKRRPDFADPPRPARDGIQYVRKDGGAVCLGLGVPPDEAPECPKGQVCHSELCLAPGVGPVSLVGDYVPGRGLFKVRQRGVGATGIAECDEFLASLAACAQDPRLPPERRAHVAEDRRRMALELVPLAQRAPEAARTVCIRREGSGMLTALGCAP